MFERRAPGLESVVLVPSLLYPQEVAQTPWVSVLLIVKWVRCSSIPARGRGGSERKAWGPVDVKLTPCLNTLSITAWAATTVPRSVSH